jgi:hypothetical protein
LTSSDTGAEKSAATNWIQAVGIVGLIVMALTIFHKGFALIAALARDYPGAEFWPALARYLISNLAGG